jgi:hypothetical protein
MSDLGTAVEDDRQEETAHADPAAGLVDRERIKQLNGATYANVETKYGKACIRSLTGRDMLEIYKLPDVPLDVALVCYCLVDPTSKQPIFAKTEIQAGTFDDLDAGFLRYMGAVISHTIGWTSEDILLKDIEDKAKN